MKLLISFISFFHIFNLYSFDIDTVSKLVKRNKLSSVDELLEKLPEDLIRNQILVFNSFALQGGLSSPTNPRVILFSNDAKFILSYFGTKSQNHKFNVHDDLHQDKVEMIQFKDFEGEKRVDRFDFFDLTCSKGKNCTLSKPNPQICLSCHQSPSRLDVDPPPIWAPYATWVNVYPLTDVRFSEKELSSEIKNVYGTRKNGIFERFSSQYYVEKSMDLSGVPVEELEEGINLSGVNFYKYATTEARHNDRYKLLTQEEDLDTIDRIASYSGRLANNLNLFTKNVNYLNFLRLSRIIENKKHSEINKKFILEYLNSKLSAPYERATFYREQVDSKNVENDQMFSSKVSYIIDALFTDRGVDTEDWHMDNLLNGVFAFSDRFGSPANSKSELSHALLTQKPKFQNEMIGYEEMSVLFSKFVPNGIFYESFEMNLSSFEKENQMSYLEFKGDVGEFGERRGRDLLVRHCIRCHSSLKPYVPRIYFESEESLKEQLRESTYLSDIILERIRLPKDDSRVMPPGGLNERDTLALENYIRRIQNN